MKTNSSTSARLQTGLLIAAAALGLLVVPLVFPLRAASMPPSTPPTAPAGQTIAPSQTMPVAGAMNGDMMNNMGAMMKNMSNMMDKMSGMMTAKTDQKPMADMAMMGRMMNGMSAMMGAMSGGSDKSGADPAMGCSCCEKMMLGMDLMGGANAVVKTPAANPTLPAADGAQASAAGTATDHAAHH